ncbi:uncharacterized protein V1516DRAFT_668141 [Lipomyces oligophaga]|uniref:uncharacterized protein n=1 Tax=Lipomyces oligophaga TaxID=45792 RepID=UPI0034CF85A8
MRKQISTKQSEKTLAVKYATSESQQALLSLVQRTFRSVFADPDTLLSTVQTVKSHLFARDYSTAFGTPEYLLAYIVRWSAARALGYYYILGDVCRPHIDSLLRQDGKNVLCIGGGAGGEVLALAALVHQLGSSNIDILAVDIADWDSAFTKLSEGITRSYWPDSQSSSNLRFLQMDILDTSCFLENDPSTAEQAIKSSGIDFGGLDLITILFTTNELFAESKPRALNLLNLFSTLCKPGALLLFVESAGSYSNIKIGSKTFPIQFLLDHTLSTSWKTLISDDSSWFRLDESLHYPLPLENMRFFIRLYEKT